MPTTTTSPASLSRFSADMQDAFHSALMSAGGTFGTFESTFADRHATFTMRERLAYWRRAVKYLTAHGLGFGLRQPRTLSEMTEAARWLAAAIYRACWGLGIHAPSDRSLGEVVADDLSRDPSTTQRAEEPTQWWGSEKVTATEYRRRCGDLS